MHMVAFMYPAEPGADFNRDHFIDVHLPMGLYLTRKHLGIQPEKLVVYAPTRAGDDQSPATTFCAISSVFFATEPDARTFCTLFEHEEAARRLSADFANYTPHAPDVIMAEVTELTDVEEMIARGEQIPDTAA